MAKTIRLTEQDLSVIIKRVIKESNQTDIDNIQKALVDTGKVSEEDFEKIKKASKNKSKYVVLLTIARANDFIRSSDIDKWGPEPEKYFGVFEKAKGNPTTKALFPTLDIGRIRKREDFVAFEGVIKNLMDTKKSSLGDENNTDSVLLNTGDILKLKNQGIELIGIVAGYQIFKTSNLDQETWEVYRKVLAKCKEGGTIHLCTMGGYSHFKKYLGDHPGSSYYTIYNQNDPLSPYQFHYESNQFKDRKNDDIF